MKPNDLREKLINEGKIRGGKLTPRKPTQVISKLNAIFARRKEFQNGTSKDKPASR